MQIITLQGFLVLTAERYFHFPGLAGGVRTHSVFSGLGPRKALVWPRLQDARGMQLAEQPGLAGASRGAKAS